MKSWGDDFGYELLGDDWKLAYPPPDRRLAEVVGQTLAEARANQARLIAAAPRPYGSRSKPVYRASSGGGFVREGGSADDDADDYTPVGAAGPVGRNAAGTGGGFGIGGQGGGPGSEGQGGGATTGPYNGSNPYVTGDPYAAGNPNAGNGPYAANNPYAAAGQGSGGGATTGPYNGSNPYVTGDPYAAGNPNAGNGPYAANNPYAAAGQGSGGGAPGRPYGPATQNAGTGDPGGGPGPCSGAHPVLPQMARRVRQAPIPTQPLQPDREHPQRPAHNPPANKDPKFPTGTYSASRRAERDPSSQPPDAAMAGRGQALRPGEWEPTPDPPPKKADDKDNDKQDGKREKSLAAKRGADWGLRDSSRGSFGVTRPIRIDCYADRLVVVSERSPAASRTIPLGPRTASSIDTLISAVWEHMDTWGIAGRGMYWRPVLQVYVAPDAERRFADLAALLEGSGLTIERK